MKYDRRHIMLKAWSIYRQHSGLGFAESLHRAWLSAKAEAVNTQRIDQAKAEAGVAEAVNTWSGWRKAGFEVIHGSKALFGAELIHGSRGDGAIYNARFFGASQVQEVRV